MSISDIVLTETQVGIADKILRILSNSEEKISIFLEGLSGVGKSIVLDSIRQDIEGAGGSILEEVSYKLEEEVGNIPRLVVPVPTSELGHLERIGFDYSSKGLKWYILPGMNQQEMTDYLQGKENKTSLTSEELVKYSLGIPNLADSLIGDISLTKKKAAVRTARYLVENFRELWNKAETHEELYGKYLQIPVSANIDNALYEASLSVENIFDLLPEILSRRNKLLSEGSFEEEPFFLAPESTEIYNEMWHNNSGFNNIVIYSPDVSKSNLARLKEVFDIPEKDAILRFNVDSPRYRMFGVHGTSKIDIGIVEQNGESRCNHYQYPWKDWADKKQEQFRTMELPIKPDDSQNATFYFRKSDHFSLDRDVTVRIGWMVESLLQQLSVPYIVTNGFLGKGYAYVPQQQKIQMI